MKKRVFLASMMALGGFAISPVFAAPAPAALSNQQCHKAFQAAKANNSLNGQNYNAFKAAKCTAQAVPASSAPAPMNTAQNVPEAPMTSSPSAPPAMAGSGNVVFPNSIPAQFASLAAGKARMQACLAQYNVNKTNGGNGNLKWIQSGGGYYSECTKHLKALAPTSSPSAAK